MYQGYGKAAAIGTEETAAGQPEMSFEDAAFTACAAVSPVEPPEKTQTYRVGEYWMDGSLLTKTAMDKRYLKPWRWVLTQKDLNASNGNVPPKNEHDVEFKTGGSRTKESRVIYGKNSRYAY
ncbi:MAG: hypothetical protein Q9192_007516, partial [Flavoplaca navasiana]